MSEFKFRKVKGAFTYLGWKEWSEGDYMVCKFLKEGIDRYKKPSYEVEVIETSLDRKAGPKDPKTNKPTVVEHEYKEGEMFAFNSNGSLNYRMEDVEIGDVIKVTYEGLGVIDKKGHDFDGKEFHQVEVEMAIPTINEEETEEDDNLV